MPPIRTPTIKPVKTERTHEENQERAYIAASRRSDRSLEARIESARRASEIHKKRTGRALRVTEQDVVNEEMYEEEDDDLPAQYRRLQSHLQTGSYEFNRRLQAYMTSQMGMRNALMEQGNFAGPYPNAPFFTNQFGQAQQAQPNQQQQNQPTMMNPQMLHYPSFPGAARQFPYPMALPNGGFPGMHNRSASTSTPQDFANYMHSSYSGASPTTPLDADEQARRMSFPQPTTQQQQQQAAQGRPGVSRSMSSTSATSGAAPNTSGDGMFTTSGPMLDGPAMSFAPFSPSLPAETQQLLLHNQPGTGMTDNPYWYTGSAHPSFYPTKLTTTTDGSGKSDPTLAANLMTAHLSPTDASSDYVTSATSTRFPPRAPAFSELAIEKKFGADHLFPSMGDGGGGGLGMSREGSQQDGDGAGNNGGSGSVTPGTADWTNFLEAFDDGVTN